MINSANDTRKPLRAQYARVLAGGRLPCEAFDAPDFWTEAWQEGVGALLWHAAVSEGWQPNAGQSEFAEFLLREQAAHALLLKNAAAEVLTLLDEEGVQAVMLRGRAVAESLYDRPNLRPQTDIDVLIREGDVERAEAALSAAGFRQAQKLLFVRGQVLLDVHVEPLGIERIKSWAHLTPLRAADFFDAGESGEIAGAPALLVAPRVLLPYLCFHAMKHSFERLVWLWDIALLARRVHDDNDWDEVLQGITLLSLQRPCFYALRYAEAHLGASVPAGVLRAIHPGMGRGEQRLFDAFMRHEQIPFLAERVFARMQPDFRHRMAFWKETIWPAAEVRRQVHADPSFAGGAWVKRARQLARAASAILRGN